MAAKGKRVEAVAYIRTSSAANVGADKDSDKRQRAAIEAFAKAAGYDIVAEFYDAAVGGADPVVERKGFAAMLERIAGNGVQLLLIRHFSHRAVARSECSWCCDRSRRRLDGRTGGSNSRKGLDLLARSGPGEHR